MAEKAYITPEILKWARVSAKISLEKAVATISKTCTKEKIEEWESPKCKDFPTISQAEKLAKLYRRPLSVFFLPTIPTDFQTLRDFRSKKHGDFSTALIFMMREIHEKQHWISTLFSDNEERELDYVGRFNSRSLVEKVATDIRNTLEIVTTESSAKPLKYWIEKAEKQRIFVSLSSNFHTRLKLDSDEVKGFAIADKFAPFIFLNSEDWDNAKLFTLVHELAHIWINETGVSNDTQINFRDNVNSKIDPVEKFCNEVAANALLPEVELKSVLPSQNSFEFSHIVSISKQFGVSIPTLLIRLSNLNSISQIQYNKFKATSDKQFKEFLAKEDEKKKEGFANPYYMWLNRNGKIFSQIVIDYYKGGQLSGLEASHSLNIKLNNFSKFEHYLYK